MSFIKTDKPVSLMIMSVIAVLFGLLTIKSGGQVLFGGTLYQKAAGNYVSFVLWFNFLAGFLYITAGAGIWMRWRRAVWLSFFIAAATIIVFAFIGVHIFGGGAYETRTVAAMSLRSLVWVLISIFSYRGIIRQ
ncbi:MAG: hypothetical protein C4581_01430 [Nitrospiraceae bacterium]|nr:MAG: hypothetical protein C4581_01430 [Nitrospiraceae bacterium]